MTYTLAYNNYGMTVENSIGAWSAGSMQGTYQLKCPTGFTSPLCGKTFTNYTVDEPYAIFAMAGFYTKNSNVSRESYFFVRASPLDT